MCVFVYENEDISDSRPKNRVKRKKPEKIHANYFLLLENFPTENCEKK